jgi:hypothetical protein
LATDPISKRFYGTIIGIKSDETPPRATSPKVSDLVIRTSCPIRKEVRLRCDFQSTNGLQLIQVANKIKPYNLKV